MLVIFRLAALSLAALLGGTGVQAGDQSMQKPSMYMYLAWTLSLTVAMEYMRTVCAWLYSTSRL